MKECLVLVSGGILEMRVCSSLLIRNVILYFHCWHFPLIPSFRSFLFIPKLGTNRTNKNATRDKRTVVDTLHPLENY